MVTKRFLWPAALAAVILVGCTADGTPDQGPASPQGPARTDSVVATVEGAPILLGQVMAEANGGDLQVALGRLVDHRLLVSAARSLHIERDPVIGQAMMDMMRERGLVGGHGHDHEALLARAFQLGLDREPRIEKAIVALLLDRKARTHAASESAVRAEYERRRYELNTPASVRLFDLVLKPSPEGTPGQAEAFAARVRRELAASPERFDALARQHSVAASAALGGDLGLVSETGKTALDPAVLSAAFALSPNTPSGVVRGQDGLHILLVKEHHSALNRSLDEVRPYLARDIEAREAEGLRRAYLAELRAKARIVIHHERLVWLAQAEVSR